MVEIASPYVISNLVSDFMMLLQIIFSRNQIKTAMYIVTHDNFCTSAHLGVVLRVQTPTLLLLKPTDVEKYD